MKMKLTKNFQLWFINLLYDVHTKTAVLNALILTTASPHLQATSSWRMVFQIPKSHCQHACQHKQSQEVEKAIMNKGLGKKSGVSSLSGVSPASPLSVTATELSRTVAGHPWLHGQVSPAWQLWPPGESHSQTTLTPFQCHTHTGCLWKFFSPVCLQSTIQTREQFKFAHRHD